jgi:hypothetical protein
MRFVLGCMALAVMFGSTPAVADIATLEAQDKAALQQCAKLPKAKAHACRQQVDKLVADARIGLATSRPIPPHAGTQAAPVTLQPGESITVTGASAIGGGGGPGGGTPPGGGGTPPGGGGTPPGNAQNCPGFTKTIDIWLEWSTAVRVTTQQFGGLGPTDALVVSFRVPYTGQSPGNNLSKIGAAEYASTPSARYATLSPTRCDFGAQAAAGGSASGYSVTIPFAWGGGFDYGYYPQLERGRIYYFNVRTLDGQGCAASGVCDLFVDLIKTGG